MQNMETEAVTEEKAVDAVQALKADSADDRRHNELQNLHWSTYVAYITTWVWNKIAIILLFLAAAATPWRWRRRRRMNTPRSVPPSKPQGSRRKPRVSVRRRQKPPLEPVVTMGPLQDSNEPFSAPRVGESLILKPDLLPAADLPLETMNEEEFHRNAPPPRLFNTITRVVDIFIVRSQKGEKIRTISEAEAICQMCSESLQEISNVLKTECGCEPSLSHERCVEENETCEYCEEVIQYMPVRLSRITAGG